MPDSAHSERSVSFAPTPLSASRSQKDEPMLDLSATDQSQAPIRSPNAPRALSLRPVKLTNLPRKNALITEAQLLLSSSLHWRPSKSYHGVKTYSQTIPTTTSSYFPSSSASLFPSSPSTFAYADSSTPYTTDIHWICIAHEFTSSPPPDKNTHEPTPTMYTHLWSKMSQDRIRNQKLYTPEIMSVTDIKTLSRSQSVWSVSYEFGSPLSPRVFTMLQAIKLVDTIPGSRTGLVITIPVDLNNSTENLAVLEDLGVKARYITIEHLKEYNRGTIIEWRKLMCVEFGGLIPRFYVRRNFPEKMALDALRFIQWVVKPEGIEQLQQMRRERERDEDECEEPKLGNRSNSSIGFSFKW